MLGYDSVRPSSNALAECYQELYNKICICYINDINVTGIRCEGNIVIGRESLSVQKH